MHFAGVEEFPASEFAGLAPASNLIGAYSKVTFAVNAVGMRLNYTGIAIV